MKKLLLAGALALATTVTAMAHESTLQKAEAAVAQYMAEHGGNNPNASATGWWEFVGVDQKCEPSASPATLIRQYREAQETVDADDTKDANGRVVATKLTVPIGNDMMGELALFRGRSRCEAWVSKRNSSLNRYN